MDNGLLKSAALTSIAIVASACALGSLEDGCRATGSPEDRAGAALPSEHAVREGDHEPKRLEVSELAAHADSRSPGAVVKPQRPSAHNTGPTNEDILVPWPYGSRKITAPGVYANFTTDQQITVEADNVTLKNFRSTGGSYNVKIEGSASGTLLEDGEMRNSTCLLDYGTNTIVRRIHCHEATGDGLKLHGVNVLVENSLIEKIGTAYTGTQHVDLIQMINARGATIRHNTIEGEECNFPPYHVSTAIQIANSMTIGPVIEGNWINGVNSYAINGGKNCKTLVKNNRFGTYFHHGLWGSGDFDDQGGNVWDCDGSPVPGPLGSPLPSCAGPSWPQEACSRRDR